MTTENIARTSRLRQFMYRLVRPSRWVLIRHLRAERAVMDNEMAISHWMFIGDQTQDPQIDHGRPERIRRGEE